MRARIPTAILAALVVGSTVAAAVQDSVDLTVVDRIKAEAITRSQVMDHLRELTDGRGPRLTGSPGFDAAAKLKSLNLRLDRTVRIALWSGEEQGLLGSRAYVKAHFADPATMQLRGERGKLSGYYNLDNGSGRIRGVYLQGHDAMRPLFEQWLAPFRDLGVTTISIRITGGTDHLSFNAVGLPGFQFIQDPLDYGSTTHHTSADTYDHAITADLMQASAVIATLVYQTANRAERLPRRALAVVTPSR